MRDRSKSAMPKLGKLEGHLVQEEDGTWTAGMLMRELSHQDGEVVLQWMHSMVDRDLAAMAEDVATHAGDARPQ